MSRPRAGSLERALFDAYHARYCGTSDCSLPCEGAPDATTLAALACAARSFQANGKRRAR